MNMISTGPTKDREQMLFAKLRPVRASKLPKTRSVVFVGKMATPPTPS